jgi:undecaprenyl-diphosphatase
MPEVVASFVSAFPGLTYALGFLAALLESVAFVGIFVPGTAVVLLGGFVAEQVPLTVDVRAFVVLVALGAFIGDTISYLLGRYYGPPLFTERGFFLKRRYLTNAQGYFAAHGGKSILSGHFLGPVRSFVPLVAGMGEMRLLRFLPYAAVGSVTWALLYVAVGYFFGASWEAVALWGTRLTFFLLGLGALVALNWLVGRFLVRHEQEVRRFLWAVGATASRWFVENEWVVKLVTRYPRLFRFLRNRFALYHVRGLSLTVGVAASFLALFGLVALVHALTAAGPLVSLDRHLFELVLFVRDPWLIRAMLVVTNLAGPPLVWFAAAAVLAFVLRRQWFRAAVFTVGVALAPLFSAVVKFAFARPRPSVSQAIVVEGSAGFPSAHALVSVVFYGLLAYVLFGYVKSWRTKVAVALAAVFTVLMVGLSRVYLGVHWPSDVLGGYLIGTWWLVILLTVLYTRESLLVPASAEQPLPAHWRWATNFLVTCAVVGAAVYLFTYQHPVRTITAGSVTILPRATVTRLDEAALAALPPFTETLSGRPQAPINLIFVGSRGAVERAFSAAGWRVADPLDLASIFATIRTTLADEAYPTAPIGPSFYEGRVQDLGVQESTAADSVRQRHHARLWLAPLVLASGHEVWVASASFDRGVAYSPVLKFPAHIVDPDIDGERDYIVDDLVAAGRVRATDTVQFVAPVRGTTAVGSPFFTDGRTHILWLVE